MMRFVQVEMTLQLAGREEKDYVVTGTVERSRVVRGYSEDFVTSWAVWDGGPGAKEVTSLVRVADVERIERKLADAFEDR